MFHSVYSWHERGHIAGQGHIFVRDDFEFDHTTKLEPFITCIPNQTIKLIPNNVRIMQVARNRNANEKVKK